MEGIIDKNVGKKYQKSYFDVLGLCFKALNQARLEANIRVYGATKYKNKWPSPYAVASGTLLMLSFLKYVYGPLRWLAVGAIVVGIPPIILKAFAAVLSGSIALRDYWEAGTIVFLFTISEWLESRASHKATAVMSSLVSVVPQRAVVAETGEEINVDDVKLNTVIAVKAGETIPIDGVVVEGYISVKTTAVAEDCVVARMAKIVEEAQNKKSRTQRFMDKCAKYYTPAIVVISALLAIVPLAFQVQNKKEWYHLALVVLVSGCPCALLLSTPVAMFCALSKAATLGVLFKGAEHLETLARIKIMAFDKTGTITRGEFLVVDFKSLRDDISFNALLYWISSIECKSSHPMAAALVEFAKEHGIEAKPDRVERFQNFPVPKLEGYDTEGKSVGYVFLGSSPAGIFCLSDVCRTGAKEAIEDLKSIGIKTVMLTGDCHGAAKRAQEQLGGALDVIHAELLPEDKARIIKELQKENPTAMIGDGLNDAPALATADIGISMGVSGSALATESGDVVLMSNDIRRIAEASRIAKKVRRKIIENVIISVSTKAAILGLAVAGHPLVWAAVLADVGTCLLVIFNSMLLLKGRRKKQCCQSKTHSHKKSPCSTILNRERSVSTITMHMIVIRTMRRQLRIIVAVRIWNPRDHITMAVLKMQGAVRKKYENHGTQKCDNHHHHNQSTSCKNSSQSSASDEQTTSNDHCHTNHKNGNQSSITLINLDEKCCGHTPSNQDCPKQTGESVSMLGCKNSAECNAVKACLASHKMHGGCCDSYRRECCIRNNGHFGTGLRGGLSEIVIE
ncbi:hypothetical protein DH2020_014803 [Rehmannia glutinosa]|uniref:P-type ATPase A domain-containing protein n=1 Tax=Rehmannia glutinosa TaxID=99300 RepID=A0ABR0WXH6_REHGL